MSNNCMKTTRAKSACAVHNALASTIRTNAKLIALRMGASLRLVYSWGDGRRKLDVREVPVLCRILQCYDIIHALCAECGGWFVLKRRPNVEAARTVDLARVMREFADATEYATRALADEHISDNEYEAFQREITEARQALADYEWHFGELYRTQQGQLIFATLAEAEGANQ